MKRGIRETLTPRNFYREKLFHRKAFTERNIDVLKLLRTEKLLQRKAFTQRNFYTEKLLRRATPTCSKLFHRETFTQRSFYTEKKYTEKLYAQRQQKLHLQNRISAPRRKKGRFWSNSKKEMYINVPKKIISAEIAKFHK